MEYENFTLISLKHLADRSGEPEDVNNSKEAKEKERKAALLEINKQAAQYISIISSAGRRKESSSVSVRQRAE